MLVLSIAHDVEYNSVGLMTSHLQYRTLTCLYLCPPCSTAAPLCSTHSTPSRDCGFCWTQALTSRTQTVCVW